MEKEISVQEYKKIYHRTIKELAKKDFLGELLVYTLLSVVLIILMWRFPNLVSVVSPPAWIAVILILIFFSLIRYWRYGDYKKYKIEERVMNTKRLKEIYKEQRKNVEKGNLLMLFGVHISGASMFAIFNYLAGDFSPGAVEGYIFVTVIFGIGWIIHSSYEKYIGKKAEEEFNKRIEAWSES